MIAMLGPSNYPPGVSGNEPQITGETPWDRPNPETGRPGPDAPGFILVCSGCREEFDALQPAVEHLMDGMAGDHGCDEETTWQILPEEMGRDFDFETEWGHDMHPIPDEPEQGAFRRPEED